MDRFTALALRDRVPVLGSPAQITRSPSDRARLSSCWMWSNVFLKY